MWLIHRDSLGMRQRDLENGSAESCAWASWTLVALTLLSSFDRKEHPLDKERIREVRRDMFQRRRLRHAEEQDVRALVASSAQTPYYLLRTPSTIP